MQPGRTLLHYTLVEKIGEGGMGVVWKADDTKLDRQVAIKVLPEEFSRDQGRLARFQREAKLLAALNHPNVAAIYGFETVDDMNFLVLEMVAGHSLAELLASGALPVEETLEVARQVADGLEAAHAAGVIHRDLKPGNVLVTPDGVAKVLDFGLAKDLGAEGAGTPSDLSLSPTVTFGGTQAGVVLGTAPYMSPEQARGKPLDKRTDIWSLGCLLYECLSGGRAFGGETVTDTLSAILQNDPDWQALPEKTPRRIRELVERCLEKNPRNRLHDIGDARIELERSLAAKEWTTSGMARAVDGDLRRRRGAGALVTAVVAGALLGALAAAFFLNSLSPPAAQRPHRKFSLRASGQVSVLPKISPDGKTLAYADDGQLWIRPLDQITPRRLPAAEGLSPLIWSPDSKWLVVAGFRELSKIHVQEGTRTTLAQNESIVMVAAGAGWGPDGLITFCAGDTGLLTVPAQGGSVGTLLEAAEGEADFHNLTALPDGRGWVFIVHREEGMDTVGLLAEGARKTVLQLPGQSLGTPAYSPTGHLLYSVFPPAGIEEASLWAVPFSLDSLETTGESFLVSEHGIFPSVSEDGTLAFTVPPPPAKTRLVQVDLQGNVLQQLGEEGVGHQAPAVSPDGTRVAFSSMVEGNRDIRVLDMASGNSQRLTFGPENDGDPAWSPSGGELAYSSGTMERNVALKIMPSDGAGEAREPGQGLMPDFSPDGRTVAYVRRNASLDPDLWVLDLENGETAEFFRGKGGIMDLTPKISPDGAFVTYCTDDTATLEVFLRPFPRGEGQWQISRGGGQMPRWSPSGDTIYFLQGKDVMAVPVQLRPSVRIGAPRKLFTWKFPPSPIFVFNSLFDVWADGKSLVLVEALESGEPWEGIVLVENWLAEFAD